MLTSTHPIHTYMHDVDRTALREHSNPIPQQLANLEHVHLCTDTDINYTYTAYTLHSLDNFATALVFSHSPRTTPVSR